MSHHTSTSEVLKRLLLEADANGMSVKARTRLGWLLHYFGGERSVTETCRHFRIPRMTFYRVLNRFDPEHLELLEDRSRRPHTLSPRTPVPEAAHVVSNAVTAFAKPSCPNPRCLLCRLHRLNWRSCKRVVIWGSFLSNVVILAALLGTLLMEFRSATTSASISTPSQVSILAQP